MAEEKPVTQLEHSELKRETDQKIAAALETAETHANGKTEKLAVQTEKDVESLSKAFDKLLTAQDKTINQQQDQIKVLSERLDRYLIFIIGLALSSMVSVALMLASLLMGKIT